MEILLEDVRRGTALDFAQRGLAEDLVEGPQGLGSCRAVLVVYFFVQYLYTSQNAHQKKCYTEKMLYGEQVSGFNDPLYVGSCTIFYLQKVLFLFDTVGKKNTSSTWEAISRDFTSRCSSSHNSWKLEMAWHGFPQDLFPLPWGHCPVNHEEMGGRVYLVYLDVPGS